MGQQLCKSIGHVIINASFGVFAAATIGGLVFLVGTSTNKRAALKSDLTHSFHMIMKYGKVSLKIVFSFALPVFFAYCTELATPVYDCNYALCIPYTAFFGLGIATYMNLPF